MKTPEIITESPFGWKEYEILDSGDGYKLERFGNYVLARPEPKALWTKSLPENEWHKLVSTRFIPGAGFGRQGKEDSGTWEKYGQMPDRWYAEYKNPDREAIEWSAQRHISDTQGNNRHHNNIPSGGLYMKLRLGLTSFKHVGVFPEQAPNWNWIYDRTKELVERQNVTNSNVTSAKTLNGDSGEKSRSKSNGEITQNGNIKVLNLFAYTGAASLAARAAGADVTHVDSVKQVVAWAKENMELSGMNNIRWIVDDALKFVKREIRRGNLYNGLILDPPAYGHGPNGERWKLDELLFELLAECAKIVAPKNAFVVLNLYSNGYSALLADTLLKKAFMPQHANISPANSCKETEAEHAPARGIYSCGELVLQDKFGKNIPLSVFARMVR